MESYVYVDFENMGNLQFLPKLEGKYFVFIGAEQKSVPASLVLSTNDRNVEWTRIEGNGKNALDFHIVYFLSKHDNTEEVFHYILSKDKGFDPLISYVNKTKGKEIARRIINLDDIQNGRMDDESICQKCDTVKENLRKITAAKRPKNEASLKKHIQTIFGNEHCTEEEANKIAEELYRQGLISKGEKTISYTIS